MSVAWQLFQRLVMAPLGRVWLAPCSHANRQAYSLRRGLLRGAAQARPPRSLRRGRQKPRAARDLKGSPSVDDGADPSAAGAGMSTASSCEQTGPRRQPARLAESAGRAACGFHVFMPQARARARRSDFAIRCILGIAADVRPLVEPIARDLAALPTQLVHEVATAVEL